ncbi:MAG: NAD-dependent epimerase/dehydratase family protein [Anaerolineae bacterium]
MSHDSLRGKSVLVTGATGCVGGRLVERLVQVEGAHVRALVRNAAHAVRIARLPVDLAQGHLLDSDAVDRAVEGCDVVMHCAFGSDGDATTQRQVTVEGTENLLKAAQAHRVQRFVHVSTIAVHGTAPGENVRETAPYQYVPSSVYTNSKIDAEKLALAYRERGLPVVVMRPSDVFGPYSAPWTIGPVRDLKNGTLKFVEGAAGTCCPIYVDDLVEGLVQGAVNPQAVGEIFLLVNDPVPWLEFFEYYRRMLGCAAIPILERSQWQAQWNRQAFATNSLGRTLAYAGSPRARQVLGQAFLLGRGVTLLSKIVPARIKHPLLHRADALYHAKRWPEILPSPAQVEFFAARRSYDGTKAAEVLGFHPRHSLARGMEKTSDWLAYAGYLS